MGSPFRCCYWSLLQVVVIVVCCLGKSSGDVAQGCIGSRLILNCSSELEVIHITAAVLGDSECYWSLCCIKDDDCTENANETHRTKVHHKCDNKSSCSVDVLKEGISCGPLGTWSNNDFERITYDCKDDPQILTGSTAATSFWESSTAENTTDITSRSTDDPITTSSEHDVRGQDRLETDRSQPINPWVVPVVVVAACLLLISIIVAIVMLRRKMKQRVKSSGIDTEETETAYANKDKITSQNRNADNFTKVENYPRSDARNFDTPATDYCDLERIATERIQSDEQYEQLNHGRNYEPLVVYEQLQEISPR